MIRDPDSPLSFDLAAAFGRHQPGRGRGGRVMPTHPPLHHGRRFGRSHESSDRAAAHLCECVNVCLCDSNTHGCRSTGCRGCRVNVHTGKTVAFHNSVFFGFHSDLL